MRIDLQKLGINIREYRQEAGLSQTDLADLIGVRQQQLARWELGQAEPRLTALFLIAGAIGLSKVSDLLRGVEMDYEETD